MRHFPWLYGRGGSRYRTLLFLEYASILYQGGVREASILDAALSLIHWPKGKALRTREGNLGEQLQHASRLGTLENELDWQRRLSWSVTQSQFELSRDRLTLFSRVIFYLLIGYMVAVLYLPIFSLGELYRGVF